MSTPEDVGSGPITQDHLRAFVDEVKGFEPLCTTLWLPGRVSYESELNDGRLAEIAIDFSEAIGESEDADELTLADINLKKSTAEEPSITYSLDVAEETLDANTGRGVKIVKGYSVFEWPDQPLQPSIGDTIFATEDGGETWKREWGPIVERMIAWYELHKSDSPGHRLAAEAARNEAGELYRKALELEEQTGESKYTLANHLAFMAILESIPRS